MSTSITAVHVAGFTFCCRRPLLPPPSQVGRFWRFLLRNFPEILDYLATVNHEQREHFNRFIETMYIDFFDSADEHSHQLNHIVNEE